MPINEAPRGNACKIHISRVETVLKEDISKISIADITTERNFAEEVGIVHLYKTSIQSKTDNQQRRRIPQDSGSPINWRNEISNLDIFLSCAVIESVRSTLALAHNAMLHQTV